LAKPNYSFQKRQKEMAKKAKKDQKKQRKMDQKPDETVNQDVPIQNETPPNESP